jgi:hypothetical protein
LGVRNLLLVSIYVLFTKREVERGKWKEGKERRLTAQPRRNKLQAINELRVESRGYFNAHTCGIEEEIEKSKVTFAVPGNFVFFDETGEDGVSFVT